MTGRTKATTAAVALATGLALVAGLLAAGQASAATGTLSIDSATASPGAERAVSLEALGVTDPGLGAWSIDITYDPTAVTPVDCGPQSGSVCNPHYPQSTAEAGDPPWSTGTVRVSGAAGVGLEGDSTLAVITFQCAPAEGSSALTLNAPEFADGTPGAPAEITATVVNGSITCQAGGSGETLAIGDGEAQLDESDTVALESQSIPEPGLGAWTVDITYNPALLSVRGCQGESGSLCNGHYPQTSDEAGEPPWATGTVRVTGANIDGLAGTNRLAAITFECDDLGESALQLSVQVLVNATVGDPQAISAATDGGTFACVEAPAAATPTPGLVSAGSGPSGGFDPGSPAVWLVAGLIGAGIAWFIAGLAGVSLAAVTNQGVSRLTRPFGHRGNEGFTPRLRPRGDEASEPSTGAGRHWFVRAREDLADGKLMDIVRFRKPKS